MKCSPIVVFVYNRPEHTEIMLKNLEEATLAKKSEIYIFSDCYKEEKDRRKVEKVRNIVRTYVKSDKFKKVTVIEADKNKGLAASVINGVSEIINIHGSVIVIEDDLVVSRDFLVYMNEALEYYKEDKEIWSISGYTPMPIEGESYKHDVYVSGRPCSWGWAIWKDRWETIDWQVKDYNEFRNNYIKRRAFSKWGADIPYMLDAQMNGKIDSWAIRWTYEAIKQNKYTIYPVRSKVKNIGLDGSGVHCGKSSRERLECECEVFNVDFEHVNEDVKIRRQFRRKYATFKGEIARDVLWWARKIFKRRRGR